MNKTLQFIQRERKKYNKNVNFLLTGHSFTPENFVVKGERLTDDVEISVQAKKSVVNNVKSKGVSDPLQLSTLKVKTISKDFADRYAGEIAPKKRQVFDEIARTQKQELLKETQLLQRKFSKGVNEAMVMESTVSGISSMLNDFLNIVNSQSYAVEEMRDVTKSATDNVKSTAEQLTLTIDRSRSTRNNMVMLILFLAALLLLLDFLSP